MVCVFLSFQCQRGLRRSWRCFLARSIASSVFFFERLERVIGMIFGNVALDRPALRSPFWTRFNIYVGHVRLPHQLVLLLKRSYVGSATDRNYTRSQLREHYSSAHRVDWACVMANTGMCPGADRTLTRNSS